MRQRRAFSLLALAALALAGLQAASAYNRADVAPRAVTASVVADSAAYLALAKNGASPHRCFVSESGTTGRLSISFGATTGCGSDGGGTGINAGSASDAAKRGRYAFHDLLLVTNKGTKTVKVWANATTSSGSSSLLEVAKKTASGAMADADYAASSATALTLAPGATAYVGVRATSGTLTSGSVTGSITVEGRA